MGPVRLSLSTRIFGAILIGLGAASALTMVRTEALLEEALFDQSRRQAEVFLLGIERLAQARGVLLDPSGMRQLLEETLGYEHAGDLGFSIHRIYALDRSGRIYASAGEHEANDKGTRDLSGYYGKVLREGRPYLGGELESFQDAAGRRIPKVDVIIPLHDAGQVTAALEVEINLEETAALVGRVDSGYEREMALIISIGAVLLMGVVGWVVQRGLLRPIRSLGEVTARIAAGDFNSRAAVSSRDEMGQLAASVNSMAQSLDALFQEQERGYLESLRALAKALEAKDAYTARHSARVARFSVLLGRRLDLPERELTLLKQGALMHDLGKIGIADAILNKPDRLTDAEFEIMRGHPVMTAAIMRPLKRFKEFADIAAWHHERWDGNGYPDGLKGESIPLLARIVAIADTWDAMTGDRVYRKGMGVDRALSILEAEKDSGQWDPNLVTVFIDLVRGEQAARHSVEEEMFAEQ